MFRNLEAEQRRAGMTNTDVAEYLGVSRATYENKKKDGKFTRPEIVKLLRLFNCKFEYAEQTEITPTGAAAPPMDAPAGTEPQQEGET